ncbi:MAG: hypothetical protein EKK57_08135 [Proteobacteria bacterium]|nr:MAG: hypothetical protein EKK57_08135 [Pseudomonadota bacterium]
MSKSYPITVRLTEEQKNFIDAKIEYIKQQVDMDIEVPAGLIIRKIIDKAMMFHEMRQQGQKMHDMEGLKKYLQHKHGKNFETKEARFKDFLEILAEYNSSENE